MELRHLRYFLAVAEECHFGRAAMLLNIVQPALSMQIRSLETELGVSLLRRTSRRVELTDAGQLFRVEAARTIAQAEHATLVARRAGRGEVGRVRIGFASNAAFAGKLSDDLRAFRSGHPEVEVVLHEMPAVTQTEALANRRIDVGYCPSFGKVFDPFFSVMRVGSWPWVVACARDHSLSKRTQVRLEHLTGERFIPYAAETAEDGQAVFLRQALGSSISLALPVSNAVTLLAMVAAGLGIALVPASLVAIQMQGVAYCRLDGSLPSSDLILISRRDEATATVQAYLAVAAP